MTPAAGSLRIGFLPFYVSYYEGICKDFPKEKQAVAERCAAALKKFGDILWDGTLIQDVESAARAGATLARQTPDVIVVVTTIAVFGAIPWAALETLTAPVLIWNAQGIRTVSRGYSMVEIVRHTGQIGTQALANTLLRHGRKFHVVTGYENSRATASRLQRFFAIARAVAAVRHARLLAIGDAFPMMTDILIDEPALARDIGATVTHVSAEELTKRYRSMPDGAPFAGVCSTDFSRNPKPENQEGGFRLKSVLRTMETERRGSVVPGALTPDEAARSARLCAALQSLVDEHRADGGTLNCHGAVCLRNPAIGITACYSLGVQNLQGRPFTCTGDLPTAIAMLLLKKLTGIAMYTEVQVMDEKRNAIVIANSGEGEDGMRRANSPPAVRGNANFKGVHGRGASFAYPLQPGPATVASFTPIHPSCQTARLPYRLVVAEGTILKDQLPDAGALAGFFRFRAADVHTGYTRWLEAGPVHHAATTTGHWADALRTAAEILDWEFVAI